MNVFKNGHKNGKKIKTEINLNFIINILNFKKKVFNFLEINNIFKINKDNKKKFSNNKIKEVKLKDLLLNHSIIKVLIN